MPALHMSRTVGACRRSPTCALRGSDLPSLGPEIKITRSAMIIAATIADVLQHRSRFRLKETRLKNDVLHVIIRLYTTIRGTALCLAFYTEIQCWNIGIILGKDFR